MWNSWGLVFPIAGAAALLALFLAMRSLCSRPRFRPSDRARSGRAASRFNRLSQENF